MDTMHYTEKKKSAKGVIICLVLFCLIGGGIIYFAVKNEPQPVVIGQGESDIQKLVNTQDSDTQATIAKNKSIEYQVSDQKYNDQSNVKIKSDMVLPVLSIAGEELTEINQKINDEYTKLFEGFKTQMASAESKYTYKVSYNVYDNMIGTKRVLSITIYQRMQDDSAGKNSMEKLQSYNIDMASKKEITESEIALTMFGKDYKTVMKQVIRNEVVSKSMMKEEDFIYALTGLENFYVKDSKFHIIFNNGELVDSKYGILDITIE